MTIPLAVDIRFHKWDDILKMPQPIPPCRPSTVFWHFARGMALAGTGKTRAAEADYAVVAAAEKNTPEDAIFAMPVNNKTKNILKIAEDCAGRENCPGEGRQRRRHFDVDEAVAVQDSLKYNEPRRLVLPGARIAGRNPADERRRRGCGESLPRRSRA